MQQIGILYSTTTGIVLRQINPDNDAHLDWVENNKPQGTTLLRINKSDVGADDSNMPNLSFLIPYIKNNFGIDLLSDGVASTIVDNNGIVVENVVICPDLYQIKLESDAVKEARQPHIILPKEKRGDVGHTYDSKKDKFFSPIEVIDLPINDKPVFDKSDVVIKKINI